MRKKILSFLKNHSFILQVVYFWGHSTLKFWGSFLPINPKQVVFASYGGRNFDDSPKALYEAMCKDDYFKDWTFIWAFVDIESHNIKRGEKVKIDTVQFFKILLTSKVWISNSGMDRNLGLCKKETIDIETWHGTPIKKIGRDQNKGMTVDTRWNYESKGKIRCAQSEYDLKIFERIMNAPREDFILCDLPRNDELVNYSTQKISQIRKDLKIPENKKVILYMPTYREYLRDADNEYYIAPPINLSKWNNALAQEYVLLFRAHYAVTSTMEIKEDNFIKNVSDFPSINDLYLASDILISDYSSAFIDFSILKRPMLCFAYDIDEYTKKRGLYMNLEQELPCSIDRNENDVLSHLSNLDYNACCIRAEQFHLKYSPHAGKATETIIQMLKEKIKS